jgi:ubiquinone/menaquinone biosynthesis C-methylase UbiE
MENINNYLKTYKEQFESQHILMSAKKDGGHSQHQSDPEYWSMLLGPIKYNSEYWNGKRAFDFGCGCGRNLVNLSTLADWETIDGCDISPSNASYAKQYFDKDNKTSAKCKTWESPGNNIQPAEENYYDFIMSHIVFQHISSYDVRFSIMSDMYRSLKEGGLCSLHFMDMEISSQYFENSNEWKNCVVGNPQYLIDDFKKIGFKDVSCDTGSGAGYGGYTTYYIKGTK